MGRVRFGLVMLAAVVSGCASRHLVLRVESDPAWSLGPVSAVVEERGRTTELTFSHASSEARLPGFRGGRITVPSGHAGRGLYAVSLVEVVREFPWRYEISGSTSPAHLEGVELVISLEETQAGTLLRRVRTTSDRDERVGAARAFLENLSAGGSDAAAFEDEIRLILARDEAAIRAETEAREAIEREEAAFAAFKSDTTLPAAERFLSEFPSSRHAPAVRSVADQLRLAQEAAIDVAFEAAVTSPTIEGLTDFLEDYPEASEERRDEIRRTLCEQLWKNGRRREQAKNFADALESYKRAREFAAENDRSPDPGQLDDAIARVGKVVLSKELADIKAKAKAAERAKDYSRASAILRDASKSVPELASTLTDELHALRARIPASAMTADLCDRVTDFTDFWNGVLTGRVIARFAPSTSGVPYVKGECVSLSFEWLRPTGGRSGVFYDLNGNELFYLHWTNRFAARTETGVALVVGTTKSGLAELRLIDGERGSSVAEEVDPAGRCAKGRSLSGEIVRKLDRRTYVIKPYAGWNGLAIVQEAALLKTTTSSFEYAGLFQVCVEHSTSMTNVETAQGFERSVLTYTEVRK